MRAEEAIESCYLVIHWLAYYNTSISIKWENEAVSDKEKGDLGIKGAKGGEGAVRDG